jgi:hypothetical protein
MDVVWIYKPPLGRCLEYNSFSLCESTLTVDIMLLRSPARIAFTCPLPAYFNNFVLKRHHVLMSEISNNFNCEYLSTKVWYNYNKSRNLKRWMRAFN